MAIITTRDSRVAAIIAQRRRQRENQSRFRTYRTTQTAVPPAISLGEKLPDGAWRGQRCFIIGGGPSLKGFDFGRLRGERIIAINKAVLDAPFADIMFAMDRPFLDLIMTGKLGENYRQAFNEFGGVKLWLDLSGYSYPPGVYSVPAAGEIGWTKSLKDGLFHGQNSGYGALNLAICLGADPIYLLGYDCTKGPVGEKNYHNGYPSGSNPDALNIFLKVFKAGAAMLPAGAPRIVNLNPKSALKCFAFGDIADIKDLGKRTRATKGYMIVSFYTQGTGYAGEVINLKKSLDRFGLSYHIFAFEPTGTWRGNLNYKSGCILEALDMFPGKDIVFIDSDAIVRRHPVLFDELSAKHNYDLSAHFFKYDAKSGDADELLSGTLWIQNNDTGRTLVKRWHEVALANLKVRHQMCLKAAIEDMRKGGTPVRVFRHPFAYTCIFDYYAARGVAPVIEHFQASRRLRKAVGYGQKLIFSRERARP